MNTDNYKNTIIETIHYDQYTCYELVRDSIQGYYVNIYFKKINKREIIAKFQNSDSGQDYFFVNIFWVALIEKIKKNS